MNNKLLYILFWFGITLSSCSRDNDQLVARIEKEFKEVSGTFAVAFEDLTTGDKILIREHEKFHAASTMKTPVMVEVFRQAAAGKFALTDSITVKNEFKSLADGSPFSLKPEDDSELELYKQTGTKKTIQDLLYEMIIVSSNLATNIIIELVDAKNVMNTMHELGIKDMQVLRGVEDNKAYRLGLNNTTTAYDLMLLFSKLGKEEVVSKEASQSMIRILLDQRFNEIIPAKLPKEVKVAHKTGFIKGIHHDSGIVILPDGRRYALVLLSKDMENEKAGIEAMARVSEMIYLHVISQ
ncbi:MAG TPA: serine hydrolase [Chryseolinea sp.]|nr:serine hydrolase [Chryseolinea sp.]